jgi:hypothetical protein
MMQKTQQSLSLQGSYIGSLNEKAIRHGSGVYHFSNASFAFEGTYVNGIREGFGRLFLGTPGEDPEWILEGTFVNGEINGFGRKRWSDGSSYEGNFVMGEPHGQGRLELVEGRRGSCLGGLLYEGNFNLGVFDGAGRQSFFDELSRRRATYEGEFSAHKRHGTGKSIWEPCDLPPPQSSSSEEYLDNLTAESQQAPSSRPSTAASTRPNSAAARVASVSSSTEDLTVKFKTPLPPPIQSVSQTERSDRPSTYRKVAPSGAKEIYSDWKIELEGEFKNGLPDGHCICKYKDGGIYEGRFEKGVRSGRGKCYFSGTEVPDSLSFSGLWVNDALFAGTAHRGSVRTGDWDEPKLKTWPPPPPTELVAGLSKIKKPVSTVKSTATVKKAGGFSTLIEVQQRMFRKGSIAVPQGGCLPVVTVSVLRPMTVSEGVSNVQTTMQVNRAGTAVGGGGGGGSSISPLPAPKLTGSLPPSGTAAVTAIPALSISPSPGRASGTAPSNSSGRSVSGRNPQVHMILGTVKDEGNAPLWENPAGPDEVIFVEESHRHFELALYPHETSSATLFCKEAFAKREVERIAAEKAAKEEEERKAAPDPVHAAEAAHAAHGKDSHGKDSAKSGTPVAGAKHNPKAAAAAAGAHNPKAAAGAHDPKAAAKHATKGAAAHAAVEHPSDELAPPRKSLYTLMTERAKEIQLKQNGGVIIKPVSTLQPQPGVKHVTLELSHNSTLKQLTMSLKLHIKVSPREDGNEDDGSAMIRVDRANVWSTAGFAVFDGVSIPKDTPLGQYSLAIRDVTAKLNVKERLPTLYVPVDVLPSEAF